MAQLSTIFSRTFAHKSDKSPEFTKKAYILDTSTIIHDPLSFLSFEDNDVFLPMVVLNEIDNLRKAENGRGRNAREFIRHIDAIINSQGSIEGAILPGGGRLGILGYSLFEGQNDSKKDLLIIKNCSEFSNNRKADYSKICLVSKDVGMRVIAQASGILAENYETDIITPSDSDEEYTGVYTENYYIDEDLMSKIWKESYINIPEDLADMLQNQFIILRCGASGSAIARRVNDKLKVINQKTAYGIKSKNSRQHMGMDILMDPSVHLVVLFGPAGTGKAQPLDAKILTPTGWKMMGEIQIGDFVIGSDGKPKNVLNVFPQGKKDIYKVKFSDGSFTECCKEHLWYTETYLDRSEHRKGSVKSLEEIMNSLYARGGSHKNHSVPMVSPVEFESQYTPIDPYLLGILLGDGNLTTQTIYLSSSDNEIIEHVNNRLSKDIEIIKAKGDNYDYRLIKKGDRNPYHKNSLKEKLEFMNIWGKLSSDKFIPNIYKYNTIYVRLDILRGLLDTDGYCSKNGREVVFYSVSKQLAEDVSFLVKSLGGKTTITMKSPRYIYDGEYRIGQDCYVVWISMNPEINPFLLSRKAELYTPRSKYAPQKYIVEVEYTGEKEAKCILIDSEDHLYVTDDFILTHNTLLALATGLEQTLNKEPIYDKLICIKPIIPVGGKDLGALPGTKEEKLSPWLAPYFDNLGYIGKKANISGRNYAEELIDQNKLELEAMTYIRGRSIPQTWIILDETQNLSSRELKTALTRTGEGSKVIVLADPSQIDTPYLDRESSGVTRLVEKLKGNKIFGVVAFDKSERSQLAALAAEAL